MESVEYREPWNKGKLVGQKALLKPRDSWTIRVHLQVAHQVRELAMFNLAIDSKLRGCDLDSLRVRDAPTATRCCRAQWWCRGRRNDRCNLNSPGEPQTGRLSLPEPTAPLPAPLEAPVRENRGALGDVGRARTVGVRHALDAPNESGTDLQGHQEFAFGSTAAWAFEAGEHRELSGHRGR